MKKGPAPPGAGPLQKAEGGGMWWVEIRFPPRGDEVAWRPRPSATRSVPFLSRGRLRMHARSWKKSEGVGYAGEP